MSSKMEPRIFVGGLSWDTTERQLEDAFRRFGKVVETQIMVERDTGRPRGFGFVTFQDQRAVEDAIHDMHGQDFDGRNITVNKAQPKMISDDTGYGYGGGGGSRYSSGGSYRGSDGPPPAAGRSDCFKCGRPGHWARDCPNSGSGGGGGGRFSSRPRFGGGGGRGGDRYGSDRYGDRYADDRYEGGRYGDRDRVDSGKDHRYSSGRDRYGSDRYPAGEERFSGERYGSDRYPTNGGGGGVGKDRGYDRGDAGPRSGGGDRYGSGGPPARSSGGPSRGGDTYRERPGPYDRPSRGARQSSYEDRYP